MLETLNRGVDLCLFGVCDVPCCSGMAPKNWQTRVIIPIHQEGDSREITKCRSPSAVNLPEKVYDKCLNKWCSGRSSTDQIFTLQKIFRENLGSKPEASAYVLSNSRQHSTGFIVKRFGECCGSTVLTAACYWPFKSLHSCAVAYQNKSK